MLRVKGNIAAAGTAADAPLEDCVYKSVLFKGQMEVGTEPSFIATQYKRPPPLSPKLRPPLKRTTFRVMESLVTFDTIKSSKDEVG